MTLQVWPLIYWDLKPIHTFGGAKELGIVHISIIRAIRGAKEPRTFQNHRGVKPTLVVPVFMWQPAEKASVWSLHKRPG